VAVVDDPVQEGLGDDGVGEQRVPVNWDWLKFLIVVPAFDLLFAVPACLLDLEGLGRLCLASP
jgi:hypothetical protein